jgi:AcrR family transcriptional regulator
MKRWDRTHEALRRAALESFAEQGYGATGTAQVAERAGVSEMTLFRHFPSKEALLPADPFDPLMAEAVRARPPHEPAMRALVEGIRQAWKQVDAENVPELRNLLQIVAQAPALRGVIERNSAETIVALADALKDRGVDEAQARVAAAATIGGLSTALLDWAQSKDTALDVALGSALDVLGGE